MSVVPCPPARGSARSLAAPLIALVAALAVLAAGLPAAAAAPARPPTYVPPVDAPVSDGFRPPTTPYGPGNRGLEYDTAPGTVAHAAADGVVTFAGEVAGTRAVTLLHEDGLKTSVSRLASVAVVVGQRVRQGDPLGTSEGRLHFGARSGDGYLDPATLFGERPPEVHLVPFDEPPGSGEGGERSALGQLLGLGRGVVRGLGDLAEHVVDGAGWVADHGSHLLLAGRYLPRFGALLLVAEAVATTVTVLRAAWEEATRECTAADVVVRPPGERRIALLVGGMGSSDTNADVDGVDTGALGYEDDDVLRFSYAGGRTPGSTGHPRGVPARPYDAEDSTGDVRASAVLLADLVEDVAAASPGVPIDLIGHSQGGLVARLAIEELEARGAHEAVGMLATIASPHSGADLATAAAAVGSTTVGGVVLGQVGERTPLDPLATDVGQLAEGSDVVEELADARLPDGIGAVSISGRSDVVVTPAHSRFEGARSVVIPGWDPRAHAQLPSDPQTTRELLLALAGAPPGCRSLVDAILDQAVGAGVSEVEDAVGRALWAASIAGDLPIDAGSALVDPVGHR